MLTRFLAFCIRCILRTRYRVKVVGLDKIPAEYLEGTLVMPNHPALCDPLIVMSWLYPHLKCSPLAKRSEIEVPILRTLSGMVRAIPIDKINSAQDVAKVNATIDSVVQRLSEGGNVLLYPSGRIYRSHNEDIRANSSVKSILDQRPNQKIILVRTSGLWGSGFSFASGNAPSVAPVLKKRIYDLIKCLFFFMKKRSVKIEVEVFRELEATDDKLTMNRKLEKFYNQNSLPAKFIPYLPWGKSSILEDPNLSNSDNVEDIPSDVSDAVFNYLKTLSDQTTITAESELSNDLGFDSLTLTDVAIWLEQEFGTAVANLESLETVNDLLQVAVGNVKNKMPELKPSEAWFEKSAINFDADKYENLCDLFQTTAIKNKKSVVIADTARGEMSYKKLILGILFLRDKFAQVPEENIGIMLPATNAAVTAYWAALFAGKTPVMINWTVGAKNLQHGLDLTGVKTIFTVKPLVTKVIGTDPSLKQFESAFKYLEDFASDLTLATKLGLVFKIIFARKFLKPLKQTTNAAILFTSGSESLPKAVPLTHKNILANMKDITKVIELDERDCIVGILPPFHSFGLSINLILATCFNIKAVYHSNPNETTIINAVISKFKPTFFLGTPTFFNAILSTAKVNDLDSLRIAILGAEKCPEKVFNSAIVNIPGIKVAEGYGITECSPVVSVNDLDQPVLGSIGKILPSINYLVVNPDSYEEVVQGEKGLLLVSGPSIFNGYYNSDINPFVEVSGVKYYNTGDLVKIDEDGVMFFLGRVKRFIKIGGEMVSLPAIESVLFQTYSAEESGPVMAVEATKTDRPELILFTSKDVDRTTVNELIKAGGLSPIHNIKQVRQIDQIPILGSGKTDYQSLKKLL